MKKALTISCIFLLLAVAASAQRNLGSARLRQADLTRLERLQLNRDLMQFRIMQRNAERDGIISFREKRQLYKMKRKCRRDAIRSRYNDRKKLI